MLKSKCSGMAIVVSQLRYITSQRVIQRHKPFCMIDLKSPADSVDRNKWSMKDK